jgi:hypothetical protein
MPNIYNPAGGAGTTAYATSRAETHAAATNRAGSPASDVDNNHKALVSLAVLVAMAFVASGIAAHSPQASTVVVLVLVAVTFLLTLNLGLYGTSSPMAKTIESYPWVP